MKNQITSFEHACQVLGRANALPEVSMLPEKHQKAIIAHYQLVIIAEAANFIENDNKVWNPNWQDLSEWKYYPWMRVVKDESKSSGLGLSSHVYATTDTDSAVGSRLCFKSSKLAEYIFETFKQLYEDYILI